MKFSSNTFPHQTIIDFLLGEISRVELIYLFGSNASGKTNIESDIDLAFWSSNPVDEFDCFIVQEKLASMLSTDIDLVDMQKASEVFRYEIVTTGKRIYMRDIEQMHAIENRIWSDYLYLNENRKDIVNDKLGRKAL